MDAQPSPVSHKSTFGPEELLACGRGEMFGPGNAQLPVPNMLMMDRITEICREGGTYGKGFVRAEFDINPLQWFFQCHFVGDPVMPGALGLDAMRQIVGCFLGWMGGKGKGRALGVGEVKFTGQVTPTVKKVVYKIDMKRVMSGKLIMGIADGLVEADGKTIYQASGLRVGLFDAKDLVLIQASRRMLIAARRRHRDRHSLLHRQQRRGGAGLVA